MDTLDIQVYTKGEDLSIIAYRQFKDILNRTHFKRLDAPATKLAQDLHYYDLRIEVEDASILPEPNKDRNLPGVIFVNKERIEYFVKTGNTLRQLRRGTLGTGVKETYAAGTSVYDQSAAKTIAYTDATQRKVERVPGSIQEVKTVSQGLNDLDNNPLFYNKVEVFNEDGELISNDKYILGRYTIEFLPPLIEETITIRYSEKVIYVLGFEPSSINEFDVFLAGRRLTKIPTVHFDPTLALDSPDGDIDVEAEFVLERDDDGAYILLKSPPLENQQILIVRKVGKSWTSPGESLIESQNSIASFLRAGTPDIPE
jgi:hypothetical protein